MLAAAGTALAGTVPGCWEDPSFPDADVIAGPGGYSRFDPEELTVPVGDTVTWGFASGEHNVSCRPGDSDAVELPDGAEPFASYGPDESPRRSRVPRGETYEHTFDVSGRYVYVCIPHVHDGMVGTVHVE